MDPFATVSEDDALTGAFLSRETSLRGNSLNTVISDRFAAKVKAGELAKRDPEERELSRQVWKQGKRDLSGRANGTIDPW
jgi:hypothetical protein